jgi:hypothetical protein
VAPLEDVPADAQDWHPGSNNQVLDLVHPSLFPLIYGRSRILPTGSTTLENCIQTSGKGEIVPVPDDIDCQLGKQTHWLGQRGTGETDYWSNRFQWLPSNIVFTEGEGVEIKSYINNLHPIHHKSIYPVIEKFIAKSIPAWDLVLSSYVSHGPVERLRVPMTSTDYEFPLGEEVPEHIGKEFDEEQEDERMEAREDWVSAILAVYQGRARNTKKTQDILVRLAYPRNGIYEWVHASFALSTERAWNLSWLTLLKTTGARQPRPHQARRTRLRFLRRRWQMRNRTPKPTHSLRQKRHPSHRQTSKHPPHTFKPHLRRRKLAHRRQTQRTHLRNITILLRQHKHHRLAPRFPHKSVRRRNNPTRLRSRR